PETSYPYFSAALREVAFAPMMTMLIRALGEVLVQLPLGKKEGVAGPNFFISREDDQRLNINPAAGWSNAPRNQFYQDIEFYLARLARIDGELEALAASAPVHLKKDVEFMWQNVHRIAGNLRRDYQR